MTKGSFQFKIYRGTPNNQYWEVYELEREEGLNIISALMDIRENPITIEGKEVAPIVWEDGCLEEVCGSCSMLVNGFPRQACSTLVENIIEEYGSTEITLAPFTKFPLIRDLWVDRSVMFEHLKKIQGWIETDNSLDQGFSPKMSQELQELRYSLARCMTCGCCSQSCPQVNDKSEFMGPAPIAWARYFNSHPTGEYTKSKRLEPMMTDAGVISCGNAQNCVKVCPKNIPLTEAIGAVGKDVTKEFFKKIFGAADR